MLPLVLLCIGTRQDALEDAFYALREIVDDALQQDDAAEDEENGAEDV